MRYCAMPGCAELVVRGRCVTHARTLEQQRANVAVRTWYSTPRWKQLRRMVLGEMPLCAECAKKNIVRAATEVDHIDPHQGDVVKFWTRANLQGLCAACHTRKTGAGL